MYESVGGRGFALSDARLYVFLLAHLPNGMSSLGALSFLQHASKCLGYQSYEGYLSAQALVCSITIFSLTRETLSRYGPLGDYHYRYAESQFKRYSQGVACRRVRMSAHILYMYI